LYIECGIYIIGAAGWQTPVVYLICDIKWLDTKVAPVLKYMKYLSKPKLHARLLQFDALYENQSVRPNEASLVDNDMIAKGPRCLASARQFICPRTYASEARLMVVVTLLWHKVECSV